MTSRLIGSGPIRPPIRPSKGQSDVLQAIDHSVAGSMTAQPPGIRPSALRVATHGQQVASLGGGDLTPLQRCSWRILQHQPTGRGKLEESSTFLPAISLKLRRTLSSFICFGLTLFHRSRISSFTQPTFYLFLNRGQSFCFGCSSSELSVEVLRCRFFRGSSR